jgi:hypothetical protein
MKNLISKAEKDQIDSLCHQYNIKNYTINSDRSIDVVGNVNFPIGSLAALPLKFGNVSGVFYCCNNILTSLEGVPNTVGKHFNVSGNGLTSLVGGPVEVGGEFKCRYNRLITLVGAPESIGGEFNCMHNNLVSTFSGDVDLELSGDIECRYNALPQPFVDNIEHIKLILKYQRHFFIWNDDLTLNEENFMNLISEIEEGLQ